MRSCLLLFLAACGSSGSPSVTKLYAGDVHSLVVRDGAVFFLGAGLLRLDPATKETTVVSSATDISELQTGGGALVVRRGTNVERVDGLLVAPLASDVSSYVATEARVFYVTGTTLYERSYVEGATASTIATDVPANGALVAADSQGFVVHDGSRLFTRSNSGGSFVERTSGGPDVVIGGGAIVFLDGKALQAMPRFEGEATVLASAVDALVAVRDGSVFYQEGVKLMRVPVAGGEAEQVGDLVESAQWLRAGDTIYGFNASGIFSFKLP